MTNGFALNHDKSFQIYFFCVKCQTQKDFLKDVESTVGITKTCLYNFDPLKPHLYIVKLGFTWVYIIFLISVQNIDCGTR